MSKRSTLIYFINKIQADLSSVFDEEIFEFSWNYKNENSVKENAPSEQAIKNIMNFARSYDVMKTANAGYVETILN